ncbi:uncharacterized protein LOC143470522 isoform X3 [Clavelina lepadiformis]|uniref:uncharacterized protein LOC143470522 isoform X3 n=1 Tax=Clavelina lepadiformis TaxID=159417 RepID=UPI004043875F
MEFKKKSRCCYKRHFCNRQRYHGYRYCYQHILADDSAPFASCQFVSKINGRKCHSPALKRDDCSNGIFCKKHDQICKENRLKKTSSAEKQVARCSNQLNEVYSVFSKYSSSLAESDLPQTSTSKNEINLQEEQTGIKSDETLNNKWLAVSSSTWKSGEMELDADLPDDAENYLKNAGVYSLEEAVSYSKQQLINLQSLYLDQFKQLNRALQDGRRKYLLSLANSEGPHVNEESHDRADGTHLRELLKFRKRSKENKHLYQQSKYRRMDMSSTKGTMMVCNQTGKPRCSHISSHSRCRNSCLPYTKFCTEHILEDPLQVLYRKCLYSACNIPVRLLCTPGSKDGIESGFCSLHIPLPKIREMENDYKQIFCTLEKIAACSLPTEGDTPNESTPLPKESVDSQQETEAVDEEIHVKIEQDSDNAMQMDPAEALPELDCLQHCDDDKITRDLASCEVAVSTQPTNGTLTGESSVQSTVNNEAAQHITKLDTGDCFLLRRISSSDKAGLHLQPLTADGPTALGLLVPEKTLEVNVPILTKFENTQSAEVSSFELEHFGCKLSVKNDTKIKEMNNDMADNRIVITSATVTPPIGTTALQQNEVDDFSVSTKQENSSSPNTAPQLVPGDTDSNKGEKVQSSSDRKPNNADEETAVASLLSLALPSLAPDLPSS